MSAAETTTEPDGIFAERVREHYGRAAVVLQQAQDAITALLATLEDELAALPTGGWTLRQVTEVLPGDYVRLSEFDEFIVERVEPVPPAGPWGRGGRSLHMLGGQVRHLPTLARVQVRRLGTDPCAANDAEPWTAADEEPIDLVPVDEPGSPAVQEFLDRFGLTDEEAEAATEAFRERVAEVVLADEDRAERLDAAYDAGRIGPEGSAA